MAAIEVKQVVFSYGSEPDAPKALDGVDLSIEEGSFVALVGHNGSGKSTLAKLLNGLLLPTRGKVEIYGDDTADDAKIYRVRSNLLIVFQNPDNQMIASIVEDDIAFGPENLGIEREEIVRRVEWALDKVGMLEHRKGTPFKMSGGQKQRLAIAGVLAIKPRVIVFDESTAMLDPRGRAEVMQVAHELNRNEKITVIHITHYMDEALQADRVVVLDRGKILCDGTPHEVFAQAELLREAGLALPAVRQLAQCLADAGVPIRTDIVDEQELIEALCPLL